MKNLKISLKPNGETAKALKLFEQQHTHSSIVQDKSDNEKLVIAFERCENPNPFDGDFFGKLFDARSSDLAAAILMESTHHLRKGKPLPENLALLLSEALDRVLETKEGTELFVYGPHEGAGRPPADMFRNLRVFLTIEEQRAKLGTYMSSRKVKDGFGAAQQLLQEEGIYLEADALKRIRNQVINKASNDPGFFAMLVQFIEGYGYRARGE